MLIPKKNDIENYEPVKKAVPPTEKVNKWVKMADETNCIGGLAALFGYFTLFMNVITFPCLFGASEQGLASVPVTLVCDVILALLIVASLKKMGFNYEMLIEGVMSFIGSFSEPSNITFEELEEDRRKDAQRRQETADRCSQYWDKVNSSRNNDDGKDFNTRQKEARRAAAYAKADPEFIVDYKSVGGAWVRDIVRGRDKSEVLSRFRKSPTVLYMGGVMGIYE